MANFDGKSRAQRGGSSSKPRGKGFFAWEDKEVVAVVCDDDAWAFKTARKNGTDPFEAGVRIFTFSDRPELGGYVTGQRADLDRLIAAGGHTLRHDGNFAWYVPFTGDEMGRDYERRLGRNPNLTALLDVFGSF